MSSETRPIFRTLAMFFPLSGYFLLLVLIYSTFSPAVSKTTTNNSKGAPAPTASVCHNVVNYNSFSAGPSKEIKNLLQEMKMQLTDLQKKVGAIVGNNNGKACCEAVGVADGINNIPDGRMMASTVYSSSYAPSYGRLYSSRGSQRWCPKSTSDRSDYLQVDMGTVRAVCAVATQRRSGEYTKTYYLQFSLDGVTWSIYKKNNARKVFAGSTTHLTVRRALLDPVVKARFIRFYPIAFGSFPCLSVEIYALN